MKSCIYLNQITTIDYARLYGEGFNFISGGSVNFGCKVTGDVTDCEKVVADFGSIKKKIKELIDDRETGFDHKLWVPAQEGHFSELRFNIDKPSFYFSVPSNAVKIYTPGESLEVQLKEYLESRLSGLTIDPFLSFKAVVDCSSSPGSSKSYFRYTHGLKDSSSWGCQNIAHGHLSYVLLGEPFAWSEEVSLLSNAISRKYMDAVFINRENVDNLEKDFVHISYSTERGNFYAGYSLRDNNVIILDTETTIEYLAEHIYSEFKEQLKKIGVGTLYVSEGLLKGACIDILERE